MSVLKLAGAREQLRGGGKLIVVNVADCSNFTKLVLGKNATDIGPAPAGAQKPYRQRGVRLIRARQLGFQDQESGRGGRPFYEIAAIISCHSALIILTGQPGRALEEKSSFPTPGRGTLSKRSSGIAKPRGTPHPDDLARIHIRRDSLPTHRAGLVIECIAHQVKHVNRDTSAEAVSGRIKCDMLADEYEADHHCVRVVIKPRRVIESISERRRLGPGSEAYVTGSWRGSVVESFGTIAAPDIESLIHDLSVLHEIDAPQSDDRGLRQWWRGVRVLRNRSRGRTHLRHKGLQST